MIKQTKFYFVNLNEKFIENNKNFFSFKKKWY